MLAIQNICYARTSSNYQNITTVIHQTIMLTIKSSTIKTYYLVMYRREVINEIFENIRLQ